MLSGVLTGSAWDGRIGPYQTERKSGAYLDTLAAAYAEARRFDDAVRVQQEALADREFLLTSGNAANERLDLYRQRKAYREK